ncbi:MAG: hypothetical protein EZS28_020126 [Streblomastix strix]|uniref:Uncharacterized protein n=1 Tax=Streblomastix strix TaxID=222440 RepID=A0A5J4VPU1_9EUKA|nr:MAG: hypothetical protein EZS28_020126 [Streblomastix strix]
MRDCNDINPTGGFDLNHIIIIFNTVFIRIQRKMRMGQILRKNLNVNAGSRHDKAINLDGISKRQLNEGADESQFLMMGT